MTRERLRGMGLDATPLPGASRRRDVEFVGRVSAQGLADVPLRVWCHPEDLDVGAGVVHAARVSLQSDEHGLIVTLGGFGSEAEAEVEDGGRGRLRLLDGPALAGLALDRWAQRSSRVRAALDVERSEVTNVDVRYFSRRSGASR